MAGQAAHLEDAAVEPLDLLGQLLGEARLRAGPQGGEEAVDRRQEEAGEEGRHRAVPAQEAIRAVDEGGAPGMDRVAVEEAPQVLAEGPGGVVAALRFLL